MMKTVRNDMAASVGLSVMSDWREAVLSASASMRHLSENRLPAREMAGVKHHQTASGGDAASGDGLCCWKSGDGGNREGNLSAIGNADSAVLYEEMRK